MPAFVVYELADAGREHPYAFVPEASDPPAALQCLQLAAPRFIARSLQEAHSGDLLAAQYRMHVRQIAARRPRTRW
jgi:hypothetical protein